MNIITESLSRKMAAKWNKSILTILLLGFLPFSLEEVSFCQYYLNSTVVANFDNETNLFEDFDFDFQSSLVENG